MIHVFIYERGGYVFLLALMIDITPPAPLNLPII